MNYYFTNFTLLVNKYLDSTFVLFPLSIRFSKTINKKKIKSLYCKEYVTNTVKLIFVNNFELQTFLRSF